MSKFYLPREFLPFTELWMSDYYQLGFYSKPDRNKDGKQIQGYNYQSEDGINIIMINLYWISQNNNWSDFFFFIYWFNEVWTHEWLHLIGLDGDEVDTLEKYLLTGENVIELE